MGKLIVILIFISLAFSICVSILLSLNYGQRFAALCTFILASLVDFFLFRPLVLTTDALISYLGLRALAHKSGKVVDCPTLIKDSQANLNLTNQNQSSYITGCTSKGQDLSQGKEFINPVNMIFRGIIEQHDKPFMLAANNHMNFPLEAKVMISELAMMSFVEQTYGSSGAFKIMKHMSTGRTQTFDLIEKLKEKVFAEHHATFVS